MSYVICIKTKFPLYVYFGALTDNTALQKTTHIQCECRRVRVQLVKMDDWDEKERTDMETSFSVIWIFLFFFAIVLLPIIFGICICKYCCKKINQRGYVYSLPGSTQRNLPPDGAVLICSQAATTTVTVSTQPILASPVVVPPYPVDARHPTPQTNSGIGFGGSNPPYPTHTPHPIPTAVPLYYPPPMGIAPYPPTPGPTPYPPTSPPVSSSAPFPDYSGSPPSYSEAVAHAPVQPPKLEQEAFGKQAPYNPNY